MGLDVYVGPLSRYYSGEWETIMQQSGRESSHAVEVVRPNPSKPGMLGRLSNLFSSNQPQDPVSVISAWRAKLAKKLPSGVNLQWDESPEGEYFTDKPAWDCYCALLLWAAYEERPPKKRLETATDDWHKDLSYRKSSADKSSRYRHLLADTELWLPLDFDPPFKAPLPVGDKAGIGSVIRLRGELDLLNSATWRASPDDLEVWSQEGAEHGAPLEVSAKFGFAVSHTLATTAVESKLPMKLDY